MLVRWLVLGVVLAALAGCRGGPGDPGTSFYVTNHCAEEVRVRKTDAEGVTGVDMPVKVGERSGWADVLVEPLEVLVTVSRIDGSGEVRFHPEQAEIELTGDRCPSSS